MNPEASERQSTHEPAEGRELPLAELVLGLAAGFIAALLWPRRWK